MPSSQYPSRAALGVALLAVIAGHRADAQLVSLAVNSAYREVKGTTTDIPVGTGGAPENMVSFSSSAFAVFQMNQTLPGVGYSQVDMRVKVNASSFGVTNLMIARTTNSQGLTDPGTVSVLYRTNLTAGPTNYQYNLSLDFEFGSWNDTTSTWTPINLTNRLTLTTFDIDFTQYVRVSDRDFNTVIRNGVTSLALVANPTVPNGPTPIAPGTYQVGDPTGTDSAFNQPTNAVSFVSYGSMDFNMSFGKFTSTGNSLHMFEFRTPVEDVVYVNPTFTEIPEPSVFGMAGVGLLAGFVGCRRRRRK